MTCAGIIEICSIAQRFSGVRRPSAGNAAAGGSASGGCLSGLAERLVPRTLS
jgi:hypothetical protein